MLTHHTEDAVWQKRWLGHPNGVRELIDVVIAVPNMAEADSRFARFLDRKSVATNLGRAFFSIGRCAASGCAGFRSHPAGSTHPHPTLLRDGCARR